MQWLLDRGRVPFLILVGSITLFLGYQCLHLEVDRDNRSMDAENEAQKDLEAEFREVFQENDSVLVAVNGTGLLDKAGREMVTGLVEVFRDLKGVNRVVSPVDTDFVVQDSLRGILLSEDGDTLGIRVILDEFDDDGESLSRLIEEIKAVVDAYSSDTVRIAVTGLPIQKNEVGMLVRRDQKVFAPLSLLVLGIILLLVTRRLSGMIFPLLVSVLTICWTLGIYSLFGHSLNMITSLLPPVIMTLSVATSIHIYLDWLHEAGRDNRKRIIKAVRNLCRPCLFTSLTTAIGFLSLLLSETPAVRLFGMFAALGVGISYVLGVVGIAVGLTYLKFREKEDGIPCMDHAADAHRILNAISRCTIDHPVIIVIAALAVGGIGVVGAKKIETDTDLLHFMGDDHFVVQDTMFIDSKIAGTSAIELYIQAEAEASIDSTERLAELGDALRNVEHVRQVFGLADLLPEEALAMERSGVPLSEILKRIDGGHFLSVDHTQTRITVFTDSIGSKAGSKLVDAIRSEAGRILGEDFEVNFVGGFYRVITESNQLVESQLKSFLVAVILILIAIGVVFRSAGYALLAIIPNVVPLLLTAAVMGFGGIAMSTGTAMIASVVIGIAVDDTIHYLSAFRKNGHADVTAAIGKTTRATGFVLLSTTMALSAGFWVAFLEASSRLLTLRCWQA